MNENERYYRAVMGAVGGAMLVFWGLFLLNEFVVTALSQLLAFLSMTPVASEIAHQVFYALGYLLAFMLPALFLKIFLKQSDVAYRPFSVRFRFSPWFPLILFAGIAVILSAAYFNASLVSIFQYSSFSSDVIWGESESMQSYEILLQFLVMCIVPGFSEEFLFRGVIFENVLPFGRFRAILITSLLFALMHQNAEQIFYAFVAGIFLGVLREKVGSIWPGVVLHVLNNAVPWLENIISSNLGDSYSASLYIVLIELALMLLGGASLMILILRFFSKRRSFAQGFFERELPEADEYTQYPVAPCRAVKLFLTPTMIAFLALCTVQVIILIGMAVLYAGFI